MALKRWISLSSHPNPNSTHPHNNPHTASHNSNLTRSKTVTNSTDSPTQQLQSATPPPNGTLHSTSSPSHSALVPDPGPVHTAPGPVLDNEALAKQIISQAGDKIFGMENFAATCYCNSILQCLYYTKPLRDKILSYPNERDFSKRPRKLKVPGTKVHPFTAAALANAAQQADGKKKNEATIEKKESIRRSSFFGLGKDKKDRNEKKEDFSITNNNSDNTNNNHDTNNENNHNENTLPQLSALPVATPLTSANGNGNGNGNGNVNPASVFSIFPKNKSEYSGLQSLNLGVKVPNHNAVVVGVTEDPFATIENKKRAALLTGPIINLDYSMSSDYNMKESLFTALKDIFESMAESESRIGVVSPSKLIDILKRENELFRSTMHQDAHEFLNFLLNDIIESIDNHNSQIITNDSNIQSTTLDSSLVDKYGNSRWLHELFEGLLTSETKCLTCETISRRDEMFLDLSIDLEQNTSVTSCLRQFSASEMLCERNKFYCDNCGGLQEAEKRMKIKNLPKILSLHLKRFKYIDNLQKNVKLFHRVVYPMHLRLFNTTYDAKNPDKLYELYAVVIHIGGGPYHGHYVSLIKTENCGWLLFDDEIVESVSPEFVMKFFGDETGLSSAYVLFYQEISDDQFNNESLFLNYNDIPTLNETIEMVNNSGFEATINSEKLTPINHPVLQSDDRKKSTSTNSNSFDIIEEDEIESTTEYSATTTDPTIPSDHYHSNSNSHSNINSNLSNSSNIAIENINLETFDSFITEDKEPLIPKSNYKSSDLKDNINNTTNNIINENHTPIHVSKREKSSSELKESLSNDNENDNSSTPITPFLTVPVPTPINKQTINNDLSISSSPSSSSTHIKKSSSGSFLKFRSNSISKKISNLNNSTQLPLQIPKSQSQSQLKNLNLNLNLNLNNNLSSSSSKNGSFSSSTTSTSKSSKFWKRHSSAITHSNTTMVNVNNLNGINSNINTTTNSNSILNKNTGSLTNSELSTPSPFQSQDSNLHRTLSASSSSFTKNHNMKNHSPGNGNGNSDNNGNGVGTHKKRHFVSRSISLSQPSNHDHLYGFGGHNKDNKDKKEKEKENIKHDSELLSKNSKNLKKDSREKTHKKSLLSFGFSKKS